MIEKGFLAKGNEVYWYCVALFSNEELNFLDKPVKTKSEAEYQVSALRRKQDRKHQTEIKKLKMKFGKQSDTLNKKEHHDWIML